jgi:hypothetical protein
MSRKGSHVSDWNMGWTAGGIMVQFLAGIREFCLLQSIHTRSVAHLASSSMAAGGSFRGRPGCEAGDSHSVPRLRMSLPPVLHMPSLYV